MRKRKSNPIVYYAHYITQDGRRVEFQGSDYQAIADRLEAIRQAILKRSEYWPSGFVQSFR